LHFVILGGSVIAYYSIQRHIVVLESDIDIYSPSSSLCASMNKKHTS
jgi:hypothetical protein